MSSRHYQPYPDEDLALLSNTLEEVLSASGDPADQHYLALKAQASAALDEVRSRLSEASDAGYIRARRAVNQADNYVHDRPWRGVGIGATVGLIVGLLLARR